MEDFHELLQRTQDEILKRYKALFDIAISTLTNGTSEIQNVLNLLGDAAYLMETVMRIEGVKVRLPKDPCKTH